MQKTCPECGFLASRNARVCARCNFFFLDAAPVKLQNLIHDYAKRLRREYPQVSREDFHRALLHQLWENPKLQELFRKAHDPAEALKSQPEPKGLQETLSKAWNWVRSVFGQPDPRTAKKIEWVVDEAVEKIFHQEASKGS